MFIFLNHGEKWEWWFGKTPSLKKRVYDMTRMCCAFGHSRVFQVRKGVIYMPKIQIYLDTNKY